MAIGMRSASSIINKLKYSPIAQQDLGQAEAQDNRAVSQTDRMIGKQVAGEQARLMELDKFGDQIAMRQDKLAFGKKVFDEKVNMAEQKFSMAEDQFGHQKLMTGLSIPIGLAATGVNIYGRIKDKQQQKIYAAEMKSMQNMVKKAIGKPAGWWQEESDYVDNYDY